MEFELAEGSIAADELRLLIERIERLERLKEREGCADIGDVLRRLIDRAEPPPHLLEAKKL